MAMRSISLTQRKQQCVMLSDLVHIYTHHSPPRLSAETTRYSSKTSPLELLLLLLCCLFRRNMINLKRLIAMAKKWQRIAANKPRRISYQKAESSVAYNKGHFVVYTTDNKRFVVPLEYLNQNVFRELFRLSEEEFGLPGNGPIRLPCDSIFMEYVISLVQGRMPEDLEKALLTSMATCCHSSTSYSLALGQCQQQTLIYGF